MPFNMDKCHSWLWAPPTKWRNIFCWRPSNSLPWHAVPDNGWTASKQNDDIRLPSPLLAVSTQVSVIPVISTGVAEIIAWNFSHSLNIEWAISNTICSSPMGLCLCQMVTHLPNALCMWFGRVFIISTNLWVVPPLLVPLVQTPTGFQIIFYHRCNSCNYVRFVLLG